MATASPLNAQLSSSWTWSPADPNTDNPYFEEFAAQGQNLFQAAGDSGKWSTSSEIFPADDVYLTTVGGTDLETSGAGGPWSSETAWADGGGGISPDKYAIPSWQTTAASRLLQLFQDLSQRPGRFGEREFHFLRLRRPDHLHGQRIWRHQFCGADVGRLPGSINQQSVANGNKTLGFINPSLYTIGEGSSYDSGFPRHHQRQQRLFGNHRLRSGDRLGQSERDRPDQRACRNDGESWLQPFCLARFRLRGDRAIQGTSTITSHCDAAALIRPSPCRLPASLRASRLASTHPRVTGSGTSTMTMTVASIHRCRHIHHHGDGNLRQHD